MKCFCFFCVCVSVNWLRPVCRTKPIFSNNVLETLLIAWALNRTTNVPNRDLIFRACISSKEDSSTLTWKSCPLLSWTSGLLSHPLLDSVTPQTVVCVCAPSGKEHTTLAACYTKSIIIYTALLTHLIYTDHP